MATSNSTPTDTRPVAGYGIGDPETITEDRGDCIEAYLDNMHGEPLPRTVRIETYRRMDAQSRILNAKPLEAVIENVEEDFGGEWRDSSDAFTPAMEEAEKAFLAVVAKEYVPWQCEIDGSLTEDIDVEAWIREHVPEWLSDVCSMCKRAGFSRPKAQESKDIPCSFCKGTGKQEPVTFLRDGE